MTFFNCIIKEGTDCAPLVADLFLYVMLDSRLSLYIYLYIYLCVCVCVCVSVCVCVCVCELPAIYKICH